MKSALRSPALVAKYVRPTCGRSTTAARRDARPRRTLSERVRRSTPREQPDTPTPAEVDLNHVPDALGEVGRLPSACVFPCERRWVYSPRKPSHRAGRSWMRSTLSPGKKVSMRATSGTWRILGLPLSRGSGSRSRTSLTGSGTMRQPRCGRRNRSGAKSLARRRSDPVVLAAGFEADRWVLAVWGFRLLRERLHRP